MELKDCDLRFCTFHYRGKCCNKNRSECTYAKVMDAIEEPVFITKNFNIPAEGPRTVEEDFFNEGE